MPRDLQIIRTCSETISTSPIFFLQCSLFFIVWVRSQTTLKRRGNVTEISILCRFFLITIKVIPLPGLVMYKGGEKRQKKSCQHTL